jgi:hypothetical protein
MPVSGSGQSGSSRTSGQTTIGQNWVFLPIQSARLPVSPVPQGSGDRKEAGPLQGRFCHLRLSGTQGEPGFGSGFKNGRG